MKLKYVHDIAVYDVVSSIAPYPSSYITDTLQATSCSFRLLWFLGVAAAAVFLGMTLYNVADTYYKYPFNTVTRTEPRRVMTFPAVTFCNLNPFDTSRYPFREELGHILTKASLLSFLAPHFNSTDYPYEIVYNTSISTLMDDLSQPLNTFLALCMWENKWQDCSELLTLIDTRIGRCYMFNGNASSRRFINKAGTRSGLRVIFNVNQENGAVTSDLSAGLKVHDFFRPSLNVLSYFKGI